MEVLRRRGVILLCGKPLLSYGKWEPLCNKWRSSCVQTYVARKSPFGWWLLFPVGGLTFWLLRPKVCKYDHATRHPMSDKLIRNLNELSDSIRRNSARVENKLSSNGGEADPAIVTSAAKYHEALELLAKE